jgi:hypothetical protein
LGDFNIDRTGDKIYDAFTSTGLYVPQGLNRVPRSIFSDPHRPDLNKFYDQIAWFIGDDYRPGLSMKYIRGGDFDFTKLTLRSRNLTKAQLSWRISD